MYKYQKLLEEVYYNGGSKEDRTNTGTISSFGQQFRFDLRDGFPLVTTKKVHLKSIIHELLWLLKGDTNIKYLNDNGVNIWNEWADVNGELGAIYGKQWRDWETPNGENIDQITNLIKRIKNKPDCRRLIVNAWNPNDIPNDEKTFSENVSNGKGALPPCHSFFQVYTIVMTDEQRLKEYYKTTRKMTAVTQYYLDSIDFPTRYLDLKMYQRSADLFLGVPFNIASYSLLTMMISQVLGMIPRYFIHSFGDCHIYNNHKLQVKEQLSIVPKELPKMLINSNIKSLFDFKYEDFQIIGYNPHPPISGKISV